MGKVSEAQKRANKKYQQKNRRKTTIDNYRRSARLFIRKHATSSDLKELKDLIKEREEYLNN